MLMKEKLEDANAEVRKAKRNYGEKTEEYRKEVFQGGVADEAFNQVLKKETEKVWKDGKRKKISKTRWLIGRKIGHRITNREKENRKCTEMKDIKYTDQKLEEIQSNKSEEEKEQYANRPRKYGGVNLEGNSAMILNKDPTFMIHRDIDELEMEVEIEKGVAKARYELMSRNEGDEGGEEDENSQGSEGGSSYKLEGSSFMKYSNLRATELPMVPRLMEPRYGTIKQERIIEDTKEKLLQTVREYRREHCNEKGQVKESNLKASDRQSLKDIQKGMKEKSIVVFTTDKSGRFSVDTPKNYEKAIMKHTEKDLEIREDRVKQIENRINQHMKQVNKIFNIGKSHDHQHRVAGATTSTNTPAPPMYGLRKDHKSFEDEQEGPPVRPVCGANDAPNSRLSHILSRIINDYCEDAKINTECKSSEEMRAAFEEFNGKDEGVRKKCKILSMDVKALYPSMDWEEIVLALREMIEESEREIEDVDWHELGKYIAVTLDKEEVEKEGLRLVVPQRREETGRKISIAYLCNKRNEGKWGTANQPRCRQRRRMLAIGISQAVRVCLEGHTYKVGDRIYLQREGGPIGLELTGAVSRVFMARWDRIYLKRVRNAGIHMPLYERYVDDSNQVAEVPPVEMEYDREKKKLVRKKEQGSTEGGERVEEDDERLSRILKMIANDVLPCIDMEADWPSRNPDGKLPILDMKVWMSEQGEIMYKHYEKPMASKTVLHSQSAHPPHCKKSVHVQEVIRRMLNCSSKLSWERDTAPVITEYMLRMKIAGYGEKYRENVVRKALFIYKKKVEDDKQGVRPIFRPKFWKREERKKQKEIKKKEWGTKKGHIAPILIPTTPGGKLARMMKEVADKQAEEGIHFNIVEVGGRTVKSELQRSNPTETKGCDKDDCMGCKPERGKGGRCHKNNVNYEVECQRCEGNDKAVYYGETSRNLYSRLLEHQRANREGREVEEDDEEGFMVKHMRECHDGEERDFRARVTHANRDCLSRLIREGLMIKRSHRRVLNTKSEWFQPPLYRILSEVVRE